MWLLGWWLCIVEVGLLCMWVEVECVLVDVCWDFE